MTEDLTPDDDLTVFEMAMRTMNAQVYREPEPTILVGDGMILVYTPKPIPPIEVKWTLPDPAWFIDLPERPYYPSRMITIVWPKPRRMDCGKWRAAGKVYRTKALAWRGLEKRGLRP